MPGVEKISFRSPAALQGGGGGGVTGTVLGFPVNKGAQEWGKQVNHGGGGSRRGSIDFYDDQIYLNEDADSMLGLHVNMFHVCGPRDRRIDCGGEEINKKLSLGKNKIKVLITEEFENLSEK